MEYWGSSFFFDGFWTPAQITTALWLDAADTSTITTVSGAVSQWNDKSGNDRHATQPNAGNRPVYQASAQNGLNAVRFTAASSHALLAGTISTWNFLHDGTTSAVFIVARTRSTGDDPNTTHCYLSTGGASAARTGYYIAYDDRASASRNNALAMTVARSGYAVIDIANDRITPGAYHIISSYIDADNAIAANRSSGRIDGGAAFGFNTQTLAPSAGNSSYALTLGRDLDNTVLNFTGDICEVLVFDTQPNTTDRQKIEGHLAHKWGLAANLPSGHPYKSAPPYL